MCMRPQNTNVSREVYNSKAMCLTTTIGALTIKKKRIGRSRHGAPLGVKGWCYGSLYQPSNYMQVYMRSIHVNHQQYLQEIAWTRVKYTSQQAAGGGCPLFSCRYPAGVGFSQTLYPLLPYHGNLLHIKLLIHFPGPGVLTRPNTTSTFVEPRHCNIPMDKGYPE